MKNSMIKLQNMKMFSKYMMLAIAGSLIIATAACVKNEENSGYVSDTKRLEKIKKGNSKDEVLSVLGSPSAQSTFGDEKWYYISMKTEQRAFLNPDIKDQETYIISFDKKGNVASVEKQSGIQGKKVDIASDTTPTEGNKVGLFQQLIGNLGKFNTHGDEE